jgi:methyltransferase
LNVVYLVVGVAIVGAQRLLELIYSRRNEIRLRARGAVERGSGHYPVIVAIHSLWLVSMLVEGLLRGPEPPVWWPQPLRYWAILSLGENWNTRVLVVPGGKLVRRGPYRYFPHPNYVVVAVEVFTFPLIFGAWITAITFSLLNAALLYVRIQTENRALRELAS